MRLIVKEMLNKAIVTWATYLFVALMIIGTSNALIVPIRDHETHVRLDTEGILIDLILGYMHFAQ